MSPEEPGAGLDLMIDMASGVTVFAIPLYRTSSSAALLSLREDEVLSLGVAVAGSRAGSFVYRSAFGRQFDYFDPLLAPIAFSTVLRFLFTIKV